MSIKDQFKNSFEYEIESIRVPQERIKMYVEKKDYVGNYDIALIKTRNSIIMIANKVKPVSINSKINVSCPLIISPHLDLYGQIKE